MTYKNYRRIRMNFLSKRISRGIDEWGELTVFNCLFASGSLSDYLSRLRKNIRFLSERRKSVDLRTISVLERELKTCLECVK